MHINPIIFVTFSFHILKKLCLNFPKFSMEVNVRKLITQWLDLLSIVWNYLFISERHPTYEAPTQTQTQTRHGHRHVDTGNNLKK